jgi:hypothetical protein
MFEGLKVEGIASKATLVKNSALSLPLTMRGLVAYGVLSSLH